MRSTCCFEGTTGRQQPIMRLMADAIADKLTAPGRFASSAATMTCYWRPPLLRDLTDPAFARAAELRPRI